MASLFRELKRRKVFRVAVVYAAVGWLLVQVIVAVESPLSLPDWADTFVIIVVAAGFPLALVLAWALEISPDGSISRQSSFSVDRAPPLQKAKPSGTIDSLAVLPLETSIQTPDVEYLSDGLTEALINTFAELSALRVVARSTVFRHKGRDPIEVGRELGVRAILTGRVFLRQDTLMISVELIDVVTGSALWGQQYRRRIEDIFEIQEGIAREIAATLQARITGEQRKRLGEFGTDIPGAYYSYLRGRYYWNRRSLEGMRDAVDQFQQAIEQDPTYAVAYAGLGDALAMLGIYQGLEPKDSFPRAKVAAERALEIDPDLGEAFATLGFSLLYHDWDFPGAERALRKAIALKPKYASAHQWYGMCLGVRGQFDEAVSEFDIARQLDPFSASINTTSAWPLYWAHRTEEAIARLETAVDLHPNYWTAHHYLGLAYAQKGDLERAIALLQDASAIADTAWNLEGLGYCHALAGQSAEVQAVFEKLDRSAARTYVSPFSYAVVHAGLGNADRVMSFLSAAFDDRFWRMAWLGVVPFFDDMRADPRFQALVAKVAGKPA